jgi:NAD(P)-dependent dehydrogenase (short-subunit alcohol dehydrogenase family)
VTGAARGLGRAVCERLAEDGVQIVGVDIGRQIATVDYALSDAGALDDTAGINTPMIVNEAASAFMTEHPEFSSSVHPALPLSIMEPRDVSEAIVWLVSDAARYVTGVALPVDAGCAL